MHNLINKIGVISLILFLFASCKKETTYTYDVKPIQTQQIGADKFKAKTTAQYLSILSTNLFQKPISIAEVVRMDKVIQSFSDKDAVHEIIVSSFMNRSGVTLPNKQVMDSDPDKFITDTYLRFLLRNPTEAEKKWFLNYFKANPKVNPELVYNSFSTCNEYQYY